MNTPFKPSDAAQSHFNRRKNADEALREIEERLKNVFESLDVGIIIINPEGEMLHWNRAALELHSYESHEEELSFLTKLPNIYEVLTTEGKAIPFKQWPIQRILHDESFRDYEVLLRRKDRDWQRIFSYAGTLIHNIPGQPPMGLLTIRNITEQKNLEKERAQALERLHTLHELNTLATSSLDITEVSDRVVNGLAERFCLTAAMILVPNEEQQELEIKAVYGLTLEFFESFPPDKVAFDYEAARVFRSGVPSIIECVDASSVLETPRAAIARFSAVLEKPVKSYITLPLKAYQNTIGIIALLWPTARTFNQEELDFWHSIAQEIAVGLANARLFEAEMKARQQAKDELDISNQLLKAADTLTLSLDLQQVLNTFADIALEVTGKSRTVILFFDKLTNELTVEVSRGKQATPAGAKFNLNQLAPQIQQAVYEKKSTITDYESDDMPSSSKERAKAVNAKLSLSVPLILDDEVIGYIGIDEPGEKCQFTNRDFLLIEGIASQAAIAIENARLHAQTEEELSRTKLLQEIAIAATTQPDLQSIAKKILEALNRHMKLQAGDIKVLDNERYMLKVVSSFGFPEMTNRMIRVMPVEKSGFLTAECIRKRKLLTHNDEELTPKRVRTLKISGLESTRYIVTPIEYRDEIVGAFSLVFKGRRDFTQGELDTFHAIAHTIGQAIENARLYEAEKRRAKEFAQHQKNLEIVVKQRTEELIAINSLLRQSEAQHRQLVEVSPDAYFVLAENRIVYANPAALNLFGYQKIEQIDFNFLRNVITPEKFEEMSSLFFKSSTQEPTKPVYLGEVTISKDSLAMTLDVTAIPIVFEGEKAIQFIVRDITQRKNMEIEMSRLDRLNLVGEMAASIGHEVRNPMTSVRGFLQLLKSKPQCRDFTDYFTLMIEELDRANTIISEFLSMAKNRSVHFEKSNLNTILQALTPLITADAIVADKYVSFELGNIPSLNLDMKDIRQLVLNLTHNGLEAMPPNETLLIKTYTEGDDVVMAVIDRGSGIRPEVLDKLGTPFFTTKEKGTGLGLAVCYSIATRHNARIDVETGANGTTFFVRFPLSICNLSCCE